MTDRLQNEADLDRAVAARLAKLRGIPVDISRLDQAIVARIPRASPKAHIIFAGPFRAIAASLLLLSAIAAAIMLGTSGGPALADSQQMAQFHEDMVSGRVPVMQVSSIGAANQMLRSESAGAPSLPKLPDSHVMACCMKSVQNKKVACVLLRNSDILVTLSVASASDLRLPSAPAITRDGIEYRVQQVGKLNMAMTKREGKWLCLVGETSTQHLMDVAAQVQF